MRRGAELTAFLALAVLVHLALFGLRFESPGAASSGDGGEALVSIEASMPSVSALVAEWETPPETPAATPPPPPPPPPQTAALSLPPPPDAAPVDAVPLPEEPTREVVPETPAAEAPPAPPEPPAEPETAQAPQESPRPPDRPEPPEREAQPRREAAAPAPAAASAASAQQRAAGSGGSPDAGVAGRAAATTLSQAQIRNLKAGWGAAIRARIERRKRYPRSAGRAEGTVTVSLVVSRGGQLQRAGIARSSGNAALDQAALEAVQRAANFPPAPQRLADASYSFTLPMRFAR